MGYGLRTAISSWLLVQANRQNKWCLSNNNTNTNIDGHKVKNNDKNQNVH